MIKIYLFLIVAVAAPLFAQNVTNITSDINPAALRWITGLPPGQPVKTSTPAKIAKIAASEQLAETGFIHVAGDLIDKRLETAWCAMGAANAAKIYVSLQTAPAAFSFTPGYATPGLWAANRRIKRIRISFAPFDSNGAPRTQDCAMMGDRTEVFIATVKSTQLSATTPSVHYFDFRTQFTNNMMTHCYSLAIIEVLETEGTGDTCVSELTFFNYP